MHAIKRQSRDNDAASKSERKEEEEEEEEEKGEKASETFEHFATLRKSNDRSHDRVQSITFTSHTKIIPTIESLAMFSKQWKTRFIEATKIQDQLQTSEGREALQADLDQKYVEAVLRGTRDKQKSDVDYVYGVYLHKDGLMFGNKRFDVDDADNIIIDSVRRYTWSLRVIFKRIPFYTKDMNKSMLLATNAHKHKHQSQGRLLSNRGYKYKYVIAPLMSITPKKQKNKSGKGLPHAMILNDNAITCIGMIPTNW